MVILIITTFLITVGVVFEIAFTQVVKEAN